MLSLTKNKQMCVTNRNKFTDIENKGAVISGVREGGAG